MWRETLRFSDKGKDLERLKLSRSDVIKRVFQIGFCEK